MSDGIAVLEELRDGRFQGHPLHWYSTKPSIAEQMGLTRLALRVLESLSTPRIEG
ncbi:MAG: hypothetical protein KatS3mg126_0757 [Lysobacteraceae bacterium]|nr:MAG: hypothetical protein KatS3mg126_0757 [Xanthomonadaceae bacterium]